MTDCKLTILPDEPLGTISPMLHGHFAEHLGRCCSDGLWVGQDSAIPNLDGLRLDVLAALRELGVPILRWPGGCYADTYHWRHGIGPRESRPRTLGESCGLQAVEDNGLGTHEFVRLCREIGAEPYLAGNVGSGSPQEMMDWIHYCNGAMDTSRVRERAANGHLNPMGVRYWGVGNENWGCGGNYDAADYAKEYRRFATFARMADPSIELIACGHNQREWNLKIVETLRNHLGFLDHLSVHRYYTAGHATEFTEDEYYQSMRIGDLVEEDIRFTDEILREYADGRRFVGIAFDEWGVWHPQAKRDSLYEAPNTLRDAVAAAGVLDTFHRWCRRVTMANLAQIVNVLQCLIQTHEDRMWLTPTYHLFRLYACHRGALALRIEEEIPTVEAQPLGALKAGPVALVSASASVKNGSLALSISNRSMRPLEVAIHTRGVKVDDGIVESVSSDVPGAANSGNHPGRVHVRTLSIKAQSEGFTLALPACSIQTVLFPG